MPTPLVADLGPTQITLTRPGSYIAAGHLGTFVATNGSWYAVYFERNPTLPQINVYKSTDNGTSFALVTNGPLATLYVCVSRTADTIYIAYQNSGDTGILTDSYDMSTETFGGTNDPSVATTSARMLDQGVGITATTSGDILLAWTTQDALTTTGECYAKVYISGAWGTEIHINAGVPRGVAENVLTVGSNFGVLWSNWVADGNVGSSFGTRVSLFYSIISGGALTSTATALLDASLVNDTTLSWPVLYPGIYDSATDSIAFPIMEESHPHVPATDQCTMSVLVGTPTTAPVFTQTTIYTTAIGVIVSSPRLVGPTGAPLTTLYGGFPTTDGFFAGTLSPTSGLYVLLWANDDGGGTTTYQNCVSTSLTGTWSAPGLFLDTGVSTADTDPQYFFWVSLNSAAPTVLAVACPVGGETGTVGVPYSAQVVATGGTPPYRYEVTNGFLPPGLSLDPLTGIISGTPTTEGYYLYTITVTDSLGATAEVTCAITIVANPEGCPPTFVGRQPQPTAPVAPPPPGIPQ